MDLTKIAELLGIHESVVISYHEEWSIMEPEEEEYCQTTFPEYLCNIFSEVAFLNEALENESNVMTCLEVYNDTYSAIEQILGDA
jgi:phenolic acid decarboxylase